MAVEGIKSVLTIVFSNYYDILSSLKVYDKYQYQVLSECNINLISKNIQVHEFSTTIGINIY